MQFATKFNPLIKNPLFALSICLLLLCFFAAIENRNSEQSITPKFPNHNRLYKQDFIQNPTTDTHHLPVSSDRALMQQKETVFPKLLWLYKSSLHKNKNYPLSSEHEETIKSLNELNTLRQAQKQNFTITYVDESSFQSHLSPESSLKISNLLKLLDERVQQKQPTSMHTQLLQERENVAKRLIMYFLLKEKGGVFIDHRATLVQPLSEMLRSVQNNPSLNIGDRKKSTEESVCFGFYDEDFSSAKTRVNIERQFEFEKEVVIYPSLEDYFIACEKENKYLDRVLETYVDILTNEFESQSLDELKNRESMVGKTNYKALYREGHKIAAHIVLQKLQKLIDSFENVSTYQSLAIDELHLLTVNSRLGPHKIKTQFVDNRKALAHLTKLTVEQIELQMGKLTYCFFFDENALWMVVDQLKKPESEQSFVVADSFVDRFWLQPLKQFANRTDIIDFWPTLSTYQVIKQDTEQSQKNNESSILLPRTSPHDRPRLRLNTSHPQWTSLQRNVWIIWDSGIDKSNFIVEMCYQNLKLSAENSGFELRVVSKQNIRQYISKQLLDRIDFTLQNANFDVSNQAIADMWRLALVYENGGVYLDASTFQMDESFEWILNIPQFPRNLIWNRYGSEPEVFMFFNSYYGSPLNWHIDKQYNTKSQWLLSYENNFIAAVKGNKLIKQMFDTLTQWLTLPFQETYERMEAVEISEFMWTTRYNRYLTAMESMKYVIGRRQKILRQTGSSLTASQYYNVWSMPGQMIGQQKLRGQTNYENRDYKLDKETKEVNNAYRYKYPLDYVQNVLGPLFFQVKFFGYELIYMGKLINDFYVANRYQFSIKKLQELMHPKSVLALKIINKFPKKSVQCLQKYANTHQMKILLKISNKVWSY